VSRTAQGLTLAFDWKESGGPAPRRSRKPGFGTRLITMVIQRQLNGEVHPAYTPRGLEVHLLVPLTHERWPGRMVRPASEMDLSPAAMAQQGPAPSGA
jgi:two-component sensor histidine kinase